MGMAKGGKNFKQVVQFSLVDQETCEQRPRGDDERINKDIFRKHTQGRKKPANLKSIS